MWAMRWRHNRKGSEGVKEVHGCPTFTKRCIKKIKYHDINTYSFRTKNRIFLFLKIKEL